MTSPCLDDITPWWQNDGPWQPHLPVVELNSVSVMLRLEFEKGVSGVVIGLHVNSDVSGKSLDMHLLNPQKSESDFPNYYWSSDFELLHLV